VIANALMTVGLVLSASSSSEPVWVSCSSQFHLPEYPPIARFARVTGTAIAHIKLAAQGRLADVKVEEVPRVLQRAVETSIRTSEFLPACAGREFTMRYTFRIEGTPTDRDALSIAVRPPNEILVITRPGVPMPQAKR
jgi:TonB family protein